MIEVLAAMLVFSLGVLAMAPMMALSITGNRFGDQVTTVAAAAQRTIEERITQGSYPSLPFEETELVNDGAYRVTTRVKDETVDASIPPNVFEIEVSVQWTDDASMERNLSFITYASRP